MSRLLPRYIGLKIHLPRRISAFLRDDRQHQQRTCSHQSGCDRDIGTDRRRRYCPEHSALRNKERVTAHRRRNGVQERQFRTPRNESKETR